MILIYSLARLVTAVVPCDMLLLEDGKPPNYVVAGCCAIDNIAPHHNFMETVALRVTIAIYINDNVL